MKTILALLLMVSCLPSVAQTLEKNFIDQNYIEVSGTATVSVVPDLIYLRIELSERDTRNRIALATLEKMMVEKLTALGIDIKKDLTVNDLVSTFRGKFRAVGDILLTKQYTLLVTDASMATRVYEELEKIDVSNISIDRLDHTRMIEFKKEARRQAIQAAKQKAQDLTQAIDQGIGRALFIEEIETPDHRRDNVYANASVSLSSKLEELDFKKIIITYAVRTRFELK